MPNRKQRIAANFSASAASYDRHAAMQQQGARALVDRLRQLAPRVPPGPILEFGCGTGAVSRHLPRLFPGRALTLLDIAPGMISINRRAMLAQVASDYPLAWRLADAEALSDERCYALIVSSLTLQWFQDLGASLARLVRALRPGGIFLCSYLGSESFAEWRALCQRLDLACTMNPLPNGAEVLAIAQDLRPTAVKAWQETLPLTYPSALDFFRSLKHTGTRTTATGARLGRRDLRRLLSAWPTAADGTVTVSYQIHTLLLQL